MRVGELFYPRYINRSAHIYGVTYQNTNVSLVSGEFGSGTVLAHELGFMLGLDYSKNPFGLMASGGPWLSPGALSADECAKARKSRLLHKERTTEAAARGGLPPAPRGKEWVAPPGTGVQPYLRDIE